MLSLFAAVGSLIICALYVAPGLTPQNSYGMMLQGFPIKDRGIFRFASCLLLLIYLSIQNHSPILSIGIWVLCAVLFVFFASITSWIYFYSWSMLVYNVSFGVGTLYMIGQRYWLISSVSFVLYVLTMLVLGRIHFSDKAEHARYRRWIRRRSALYERKYGNLLPVYTEKRNIALALIFIEDMSRPWLVRVFENMLHKIKGGIMSTGIMQVRSNTTLSNIESVKKGMVVMEKAYTKHPIKDTSHPDGFRDFAEAWNGEGDYCYLLQYVYAILKSLQ